MQHAITSTTHVKLTIPMWEFIAMMAALLAVNAFAIDSMLPALGAIAGHYQISHANDQQLIIFVFVLGFGFPQLVFGPLSDRYGRKGLLLLSLCGFALASFICMMVKSFETLLAARFVQGIFAAGARVIAGAIIRDVLAGRAMAKIMSLVLTVFMIVPVLAPIIGTVIMNHAHWNWIFGCLGISGFLVLSWIYIRLPQTLPPDKRQNISFKTVFGHYGRVLSEPVSCGYMLASAFIFAGLFAFIGASEQIFDEAFGVGDKFWLWFAAIALGMAAANLVNARIVERVGMRRISHLMLLCFIALALLNWILLEIFGAVFAIFLPIFSINFACIGLIGANFSALALEPQGARAGTANAVYGFATSTLASLIGYAVASQFDGSVIPIMIGFVVLGCMSLGIVFIIEGGRLFATHHKF